MIDLRKRDDAVTVREIDQEVLVLDTRSNLIHKLNQTASFIWQALDEALSADEIARKLANRFDVDYAVAIIDIEKTLARFLELKLVVSA